MDDYREKLKGLSPTEVLDQIRRLEATVVELQRQQWRKITPIQREKFIINLQKGEPLKDAFVELYFVVGDTELKVMPDN